MSRSMSRLIFGLVAVAGLSGAAWAHGSASWIMNGDYRGADGKGCCGPKDCAMEMANDVVATDTGWYVRSTKQQFRQNDPRVFSSIDNHYWTCRRPDSVMAWKKGASRVRCLFVPVQT